MTKEKAIKHLEILKTETALIGDMDALDMAISALKDRPKGKWIPHPSEIFAHLVCNKCLSSAPYNYETNFCPNCGADMRAESEDKE